MISSLRQLHDRLQGSQIGLAWSRGREMELMHRAMGFAALGFLTLVPLLVVVAAAAPGAARASAAGWGRPSG